MGSRGTPPWRTTQGARATCPKVPRAQLPPGQPLADRRSSGVTPPSRRAHGGTSQPFPCPIPPPQPFLLGALPQKTPASGSAPRKPTQAKRLLKDGPPRLLRVGDCNSRTVTLKRVCATVLFFFNKFFFYSFIFGCVGSSLLRAGFL